MAPGKDEGQADDPQPQSQHAGQREQHRRQNRRLQDVQGKGQINGQLERNKTAKKGGEHGRTGFPENVARAWQMKRRLNPPKQC